MQGRGREGLVGIITAVLRLQCDRPEEEGAHAVIEQVVRAVAARELYGRSGEGGAREFDSGDFRREIGWGGESNTAAG